MTASDEPPAHIRPTTDYWQTLRDGRPEDAVSQRAYRFEYPARLPDGRVLLLPLRVLPEGDRAVASLIANHASFAVVDVLADQMAALARSMGIDVVVGMPTLGLAFAPLVAQRLGHTRYVPLGYSRKFWYDDALSEPIFSLTSPHGEKRLYLDPNIAPYLAGSRVCIVDDAISTGSSILAGHRLFTRLGFSISGAVVAMKQSTRWQAPLAAAAPALSQSVRAVFGCPLFARAADGWVPIEGTSPAIP